MRVYIYIYYIYLADMNAFCRRIVVGSASGAMSAPSSQNILYTYCTENTHIHTHAYSCTQCKKDGERAGCFLVVRGVSTQLISYSPSTHTRLRHTRPRPRQPWGGDVIYIRTIDICAYYARGPKPLFRAKFF